MRRALGLALIAFILVACATPAPVPTDRKGLLQRIAEGGRTPAQEVRADAESGADAPHPPKSLQLRWPLKHVRVTSPFGRRGKEFHEGVDLHASIGTPVYAAERAP